MWALLTNPLKDKERFEGRMSLLTHPSGSWRSIKKLDEQWQKRRNRAVSDGNE